MKQYFILKLATLLVRQVAAGPAVFVDDPLNINSDNPNAMQFSRLLSRNNLELYRNRRKCNMYQGVQSSAPYLKIMIKNQLELSQIWYTVSLNTQLQHHRKFCLNLTV